MEPSWFHKNSGPPGNNGQVWRSGDLGLKLDLGYHKPVNCSGGSLWVLCWGPELDAGGAWGSVGYGDAYVTKPGPLFQG